MSDEIKPRGRNKQAYQAAWIELAEQAATTGDAGVIGALGAGLTKSVPVREIRYLNPGRDVKRYRHFLERIEALVQCADDPQTASAICDLLERAPFSVEDCKGVYGPAIDLLVRIADVRSVPRLRALRTRRIHLAPAALTTAAPVRGSRTRSSRS